MPDISISNVPHRNYAVLILDTIVSLVASLFAALIVRATIGPFLYVQHFIWLWLLAAGIFTFVGIILFKTQRIVIRHSTYISIGRLGLMTLFKEFGLSLCIFFGLIEVTSSTTEYTVMLYDMLLTFVMLVVTRVIIISIYQAIINSDYESNAARMPVLVYGTSDKSVAMVTRFNQSMHYDVVGFLTPLKDLQGSIVNGKSVYYFEDEESLERLRVTLGFECVLFATDKDASKERDRLMDICSALGVHVLLSPNVDIVKISGVTPDALHEVTTQENFIPDGMGNVARNFKRAVDCVMSALLIVVFSPLMLICYIAIKAEDHGPALYKQERIGRFGRPFKILKFRSMKMDAEAAGPALYQGGDDPRLTKVGKFLRQHHLDELPQLFNVFVGQMAFIGPRPERKFYIDQIMAADPRYYYLYQIRPGVTSYATLYNGYTDTLEKMLKRLELDLYYLRHRSWWFDMKILGMTFMSIVFGKKF